MKYREPRKPAETTTKIHDIRGVSRAILRSISCSGAHADGVSSLASGSMLAIELLGSMRNATVVWSHEKSFGLKFETPLNQIELAAIHRSGSVSQRVMGRSVNKPFENGFRELR